MQGKKKLLGANQKASVSASSLHFFPSPHISARSIVQTHRAPGPRQPAKPTAGLCRATALDGAAGL